VRESHIKVMAEPLPPLRAIRYFEAAARHLSITKAAQELHVTHCAISHQIKGLEEWLGILLLSRLKRRIALTDAGQAYVPYVRSVREALDRLASGTRWLRDIEGVRSLTVSVSPSFAARWLVPRLGSFHRSHPEIEFRIVATQRLIDFDREDVDIAIRHGSGTWPGLRADLLIAERFVPVCTPRLLRTGKSPKKPEDVVHHTLLYDMNWPDLWPRWFEAAGLRLSRRQRRLSFSNSDLMLQAALDGVGVALAQIALAGDDLAAGRLAKPFDMELTGSDGYFVVSPVGRADNLPAAAFREWLFAEMEQGSIVGRALAANSRRRPRRQARRSRTSK
jgi:LysR family transcriptional regulator, glycine cleavage system transcriptional activator